MSHDQRKSNLNYNQNKRDTNRPFIKGRRNERNSKCSAAPLISNSSLPTKRGASVLDSDQSQPPSKRANIITSNSKVNSPPRKVIYPNPCGSFGSAAITKNSASKRLQQLRADLQKKVLEDKRKNVDVTSVNSAKSSIVGKSVCSTRTKFREYKSADFCSDSNDSLECESNYGKNAYACSTQLVKTKDSLLTFDHPSKITHLNSNFVSISKSYASPVTKSLQQTNSSFILENSSRKLNFETIHQKKTPNSNLKTTNIVEKSYAASPLLQNDLFSETENPFRFNERLSNCSNVSQTPKGSEIGNDSMEWSPIDDETIVRNIHKIRKHFDYNRKTTPDTILNDSYEPLKTLYNRFLYIVVDTNIFLSHLPFLTTITNMTFQDFGKAVVVIPWMVIQELDYMKISNDRESLKRSARKAVHFINAQLMDKHPQFKGQTVMEASRELLSSNNPDDGILSCCLQLAEHGKATVLLSNDMNLRNKAMMNNIRAFSNNDILNELNNSKATTEPVAQIHSTDLRSLQKIRILLSNLLTEIIKREMNAAYGDIWPLMAKIVPPFTTEEAVNFIDKYWISVFSFNLQKQCKQKVEEFAKFLKTHKHSDFVSINDYNKFIEYSLSLCIYLKNGYPGLKQLVTDCILNIQKAA